MTKDLLVPVRREGWPFVGAFALATLLLGWLAGPLGWLGLILTLWCAHFFRDPDRVTPTRHGLVVSAADGVIQAVDTAPPPAELGMGEEPRSRIAVFMSPFDVHVNRMPCDGIVSRIVYRPGRFINASLDKASELNERQSLRIACPDGRELACVQIAGLIARRIDCWVAEGTPRRAGERIGMIRFGSRVEVYLPAGSAPLVAVGQRTVAGETVLADLAADEGPREGEIR